MIDFGCIFNLSKVTIFDDLMFELKGVVVN